MYDAIQSVTQEFLANFAPTLAMMGKDLARSTPGRETASTGAPVFRHGSAASDDVHAILRDVRGITRVVGHSKGALAIENALRSLSSDRTQEISVQTFGCVISEAVPCKQYSQYLGLIDVLGFWNSLNNFPEHRPLADHSTNSLFPLSLQVTVHLQMRAFRLRTRELRRVDTKTRLMLGLALRTSALRINANIDSNAPTVGARLSRSR
jgi:hypothetical protein